MVSGVTTVGNNTKERRHATSTCIDHPIVHLLLTVSRFIGKTDNFSRGGVWRHNMRQEPSFKDIIPSGGPSGSAFVAQLEELLGADLFALLCTPFPNLFAQTASVARNTPPNLLFLRHQCHSGANSLGSASNTDTALLHYGLGSGGRVRGHERDITTATAAAAVEQASVRNLATPMTSDGAGTWEFVTRAF